MELKARQHRSSASDHTAISRRLLAEQVKDRLLQDILSGKYLTNSRIVETRLARDLGTSQAPVREAILGLEALGLVELTPFRGARVRRPSRRELLEAYDVRFVLEALGARLAVRRMTEDDVAELEMLKEKMHFAAGHGDRHALAVADAGFHGRIIEISGNPNLERSWRAVEPYSRTYLTLLAPGVDAQWTADLHTPILEAIRQRDSELVVAALRSHFDNIVTRLGVSWKELLPEPDVALSTVRAGSDCEPY